MLAALPLMTTVDAQAAPANKGTHMPQPKSGGVTAEISDGSVTSPGGTNGVVGTDLSSGRLTFWGENGFKYGQSQYSMYTGIQYRKDSGGQILARFYYLEGGNQHPDDGAFYQNAGETKSYFWGFMPLPANCNAYGKMWVSGQTDFLTPSDHPC
ncbi:hypothetical protein TR51_05185 [Kitasatospora griseola]|uniref:Uncharacterized protein n=1 Tax=Kitasatospora griseola TaxID=2064 RepID=A0A0D0P5G1_KITGR|nr:hypothetical protein TR51_05185 [Kitasatospora griseola]